MTMDQNQLLEATSGVARVLLMVGHARGEGGGSRTFSRAMHNILLPFLKCIMFWICATIIILSFVTTVNLQNHINFSVLFFFSPGK